MASRPGAGKRGEAPRRGRQRVPNIIRRASQDFSGGTACNPAQGFLCLESEGSPILFRKLRIRELP